MPVNRSFGIFSSCCGGISPPGNVAATYSERHNHVMGRERGQSSPDLFSTEVVRDSPPRLPAEKVAPARPRQRHVLPKNLPNAVKHLSDEELALLHAATFDEMKRRGKAPPSNSGVLPRNSLAERSPKRARSLRRVNISGASLPSGKVNAIRAAFKAGVRPSAIARQFGISKSSVMGALATEEPKR